MVDTDPVQKWLMTQQEIASRLILIPSEAEILSNTVGISSPESDISKKFLPKIIKYAGQQLNAHGITNVLLDSYNTTINQGEIADIDGAILLVLLGNYAKSIIPDNEVVRMVQQNIDHAIEMARMKQTEG
jgi:hypothetical protein